jgi:hypothetical protein
MFIENKGIGLLEDTVQLKYVNGQRRVYEITGYVIKRCGILPFKVIDV